MKKLTYYIIVATLLLPLSAAADEGMWLVQLLEQNLMRQMKAKGLMLDAKEIYNEKGASIAGAVVSLDFGCTGSIISDQGLMITNHHCAYDDIHNLSTPEKNYLENGFFARSAADEIPIPGKSVQLLHKVLDVTNEVLACKDSVIKARGAETALTMRGVLGIIEKRYHAKDTTMEVLCNAMWRGMKYYVYFYEVYTDVRLVAAPPVSLGAFGGETDNWEWPQHKIDFTMYRVYTGKNGQPASYAADNVPLKPHNVLNVSTKGVKDGDFTMVLGYPGRTNRYQPSWSVAQKEHVTNPVITKLRRARLDIMKRWMDTDSIVRLKYADKYFGLSNYQEYLEGETQCFRRYHVEEIKAAEEAQFREWIAKDPARQHLYGPALDVLKKAYTTQNDVEKYKTYYRETIVSGSDLLNFSNRLRGFKTALEKGTIDSVLSVDNEEYKNFVAAADKFYAGYDSRINRDLLPMILCQYTANVPQKYWGDYLPQLYADHKGDCNAVAAYLLEASHLTTKEKCFAYLETKPRVEEMVQDPLFRLNTSMGIRLFTDEIKEEVSDLDLYKSLALFTQGLCEMRTGKGIPQYPDANSTMRITYGTIGGISPSDAVNIKSQTTSVGYLEKYNPDSYEFHVLPKTLDLVTRKDFGKWANKQGELNVCFLSNNDITGGNSGSPVLNGKGELIGLAFDGNKESLAGDAYFHPQYNKTVSVDIRAVLWVLDKYAGMQYLLDEIKMTK